MGRTFIEPKQSIRDFGVKLKLNPVRHLIRGQRVILVDDSLVRGTTSRKIVRIVRQAGAKEVHIRISCPPTVSPCYYGIDTPDKNELIAANQNLESIRAYTEADSLEYLSIEGLRQAVDDEREGCEADGHVHASYHFPVFPGAAEISNVGHKAPGGSHQHTRWDSHDQLVNDGAADIRQTNVEPAESL